VGRQPSGSAPGAAGQRLGTRRLRELLAARGEAGLWLAEDDDGVLTLLRLYPGLPTQRERHALELAVSQVAYARDSRLVPIEEIAPDVWPRLTFACPDAEPLARRIARESMAPEAAVAMCADVTGALAALARAGVPPVDVSPADVVLVGGRARLLADVGLPGGTLAHACVDLQHVAPERAAAIADRARGERAAAPGGGSPTAQSMSYALASIVAAAIRGPHGADPPPPRLEQVLRRGLAPRPSERYGTPAALAEALRDAIGGRPAPSAPRARRARPTGGAPHARTAARRPARRGRRRRVGVFVPAALAVAVAAVVGVLAGSAGTAPDPPPALTLAGGGMSVEAPRGWVRGKAGDVSPELGAPVLAARPAGVSSTVALVVTRTVAPLLARVADAVPEPVRLGESDAWRYRDVAIDDAGVADVYVLADGAGTIVAACLGSSEAPAAARARCSSALTTLRLDDGPATALGGDPEARRALAQVVDQLDRARERERRALAAARTGRRQAAAATRLAAAYARAADGARSAGTVGVPGRLPRLVDRLERTGRAYAELAVAARAARRPAYALARKRVDAHERALQRGLAALVAARSSG